MKPLGVILCLVGACAPPVHGEPQLPAPYACAAPSGGRVGACPGDLLLPAVPPPGAFWLGAHLGEVVVVHVASLGTPIDVAVAVFMDTLPGQHVSVSVLTDQPIPNADGAAAWMESAGLTHTVAFDPTATHVAEWAQTTQFPTILVLDGAGTVLARIHEQYETQLPIALGQ